MTAPEINGFGHIDLTVSDAERSANWWEQVMGFTLVNSTERQGRISRGMYHPCGVSVILVQHGNRSTGPFDERTVGLDHFALRVPDRDVLDAWARHLDDLEITNSGVREENGGPLIVFRDPDNIQLEVWAFDPALVDLTPS
jgi:glyoxylase I family protein